MLPAITGSGAFVKSGYEFSKTGPVHTNFFMKPNRIFFIFFDESLWKKF